MLGSVSVEHITKLYHLGSISAGTLQEDFARIWARLRKQPDPLRKVGQTHERFSGGVLRALDDVSFEVQPGEAFGIIGRNGAGKSTLLKILSQVTVPTEGRIRFRGRFASLLEVGTGFHPDLTGRENVFLNGAVMGMTRADVRTKFDEIVAFSECEKFIDTPVKRYSSGMYVRLAFAVAAHLEPEILIVDEVLAVGDAEFQRKCLRKMGEVSGGGRTVLFVSHNMATIRKLCRRALLLKDGSVAMVGPADAAVDQYLSTAGTALGSWSRPEDRPAPQSAYIHGVELVDEQERTAGTVRTSDSFTVRVFATCVTQTPPVHVCIRVSNQDGIVVFASSNTDADGILRPITVGDHQYDVTVPGHFLSPGRYRIWVLVQVPRVTVLDEVDELTLNVEDTSSLVRDDRGGVVSPLLQWQDAHIPARLNASVNIETTPSQVSLRAGLAESAPSATPNG
jgi:lipopolysaccharide transport system ATP-binding protein